MKHSLQFKITATVFLTLFICIPIFGADLKSANQKASSFSIKNDMAFISVLGSRPSASSLKGFQKAVLYNAQGAKVKEISQKVILSILSIKCCSRTRIKVLSLLKCIADLFPDYLTLNKLLNFTKKIK